QSGKGNTASAAPFATSKNNTRTAASVPRTAARASAEEAAHIAAAMQDPEASASEEEVVPILRPQKPAQGSSRDLGAASASAKGSISAQDPPAAHAQAQKQTGSGSKPVKAASKRSLKFVTVPPPSTSEKASAGTRRTDRPMLDKSRGVPQQNCSEAVYEHNIKLSQPAVDSLFGAELTAGYSNFEYYSTFLEGDAKKEWWVCLKCGQHKKASRPGSSTNLVHHAGSCKGTLDLGSSSAGSSASGTDSTAVEKDETAVAARPGAAVSSISTATTYSGLGVMTWLSGSGKQFCSSSRTLSPSASSRPTPSSFVRSIDVRMTLALKSHQTVRRDIGKIYKLMKRDIRSQLHAADTLVSLQHDAWTNKGFQHSFVVIIASWVTPDWKYREVLLSFDVLNDRHTGATFAGHIVRTLRRFNLDQKWFGPVISDSTGTNHRMLDLFHYEIAKHKMQLRRATQDDQPTEEAETVQPKAKTASKDAPSISAFPDAEQRRSGGWKAADNKILCMNHHINLAVRAGFATFGVSIKTKTQRKVLGFRETDEDDDDGGEITIDDESEDDEPDSEADDGGEEANDDDEEEEEEEEDAAVDSELAAEQGPHQSEIEDDDGGGPGAGAGAQQRNRNLKTAIGRLEGFVTAVTRSDLRRKAFQRTIAKEYREDQSPDRAKSPIPPKPNATRWNSQLAMIEGAFRVKEAIDTHCRSTIGTKDDVFGRYLLSDQQWAQLEALKPLLELAQDITKELEAAEGMLCLVLDHHASLRDEIECLRDEVPKLDLGPGLWNEMRAFLDAMSKKLRYYRNLALDNRLTNVAAVLHPMFRLKLFKDAYPGHEVEAEKHLRSLVAEMFGDSASVAAGAKEDAASGPAEAGDSNRKKRASRVVESRRKRQNKVVADANKRPNDKPDESLGTWTSDNERQFPMLAKIARIVLGIPGSSSSSERAFSRAALYSTNRRARLTAEAIGQLVSVNDWLAHGADPLIGLGLEARQTAATIARIADPKK
ncbi:hypothetical protein OC835_007549, partial [Tilletia horrida]